MANRTKLTPEKVDEFLELLAETANVTKSAVAIGMSRRGMYDAREREPKFAARWDEAVAMGADALEQEARRRGFQGWEEPLYHKGRLTGDVVRKYSDTLLIFMLKGALPDKYRERSDVRHVISHEDWLKKMDEK